MPKRLTYKQRVLRRYKRAVCDMALSGGYAIWIPSKVFRGGQDRISGLFRSRVQAWRDAANRLSTTSTTKP